MTWHPFGDRGPLVDDLVAGKIQVPTPDPPPADVWIERVRGGGFKVSYGRGLGKRHIELSKQRIVLKRLLGSYKVPLSRLKNIQKDAKGLYFVSLNGGAILWPAGSQIICSWLHDLLLRNLVTVEQ